MCVLCVLVSCVQLYMFMVHKCVGRCVCLYSYLCVLHVLICLYIFLCVVVCVRTHVWCGMAWCVCVCVWCVGQRITLDVISQVLTILFETETLIGLELAT